MPDDAPILFIPYTTVVADSCTITDMATLQINRDSIEIARVCAPDKSSDTPYTVKKAGVLVARFVYMEDAEIFVRIIARGSNWDAPT